MEAMHKSKVSKVTLLGLPTDMVAVTDAVPKIIQITVIVPIIDTVVATAARIDRQNQPN